MLKTIVSIVGARPQFIKLYAFNKAIEKCPEIMHDVIHTGQHFDYKMSEGFFNDFKMTAPKYNLGINSCSREEMLAKMIPEIVTVLTNYDPYTTAVVVYGDTNSTLAGAIAAKNLGFKLCHVEAGLRSDDLSMPEEINRIETDRLSDLLCCPSKASLKNLKKVCSSKVVYTGDLTHDLIFEEYLDKHDCSVMYDNYVLMTIHRESNVKDFESFKYIYDFLNNEKFLNMLGNSKIHFLVHPRTKQMLIDNNIEIKNVLLLEPCSSYFEMLKKVEHAKFILTDSGGLQKEAYMLGKKCGVFRNTTEWVETLADGLSMLIYNSETLEKFVVEDKRLYDISCYNTIYMPPKCFDSVADAILSGIKSLIFH